LGGPSKPPEQLLHWIYGTVSSARFENSATPRSRQDGHKTRICDYPRLYHHHGPWRDCLFHDRPTCARSRLIIFRPEHGQPKVPFSWCRCHILDLHYRWSSMGPKETAITIPGAPREIVIFDVQGRGKAQIKHFLGTRTGSRTPQGLGLMLVNRLHRIRRILGQPIAL
jgi:hypothetical protein